jgi:hypothetical protein
MRTFFSRFSNCLLSIFLCGFSLSAYESKQSALEVRHIEGKGIGYQKGYTTLQLFNISSQEIKGIYPYLDWRGHLFNDGKFASNAGLGFRWVNGCRIWGGNVYYDYRKILKKNLNQISLGFENLGMNWDFFANGYLVVGRSYAKTQGIEFGYFDQNSLYYQATCYDGMSGADATVRYHTINNENFDVYLDITPYYYHSSHTDSIFGGKFSASFNLANLFFAKGSVSYDHSFKWIGQGVLGLTFPLGKKVKAPPCKKWEKQPQVFAERLSQIPNHNEIIVAKKFHKYRLALNPATGTPYTFWFVNNQSNSQGTFESPFPLLNQAEEASKPYDIIYVFPGDGTTTSMDQGISLKDFQQLWGSSIPHTLITEAGPLIVPNFSATAPKIFGPTVTVSLSNQNTVSGMEILFSGSATGIQGIGKSGASIYSNVIQNINPSTSVDSYGIYMEGPSLSGIVSIQSNQINYIPPEGSDNTRMKGINFYVNDAGEAYNLKIEIINNQIFTKRNGFTLGAEDGSASSVDLLIQRNTLATFTTSQDPIACSFHGVMKATFNIRDNNIHVGDQGIYLIGYNDSQANGTIYNNRLMQCKVGIKLKMDGGNSQNLPFLSAAVKSNRFSNFLESSTASFDAYIENGKYGIMCLKVNDNYAPTTPPFIFNNENPSPMSGISILNLSSYKNNTVSSTITTDIETNPTCPTP